MTAFLLVTHCVCQVQSFSESVCAIYAYIKGIGVLSITSFMYVSILIENRVAVNSDCMF